jgi:hypothetical protein
MTADSRLPAKNIAIEYTAILSARLFLANSREVLTVRTSYLYREGVVNEISDWHTAINTEFRA